MRVRVYGDDVVFRFSCGHGSVNSGTDSKVWMREERVWHAFVWHVMDDEFRPLENFQGLSFFRDPDDTTDCSRYVLLQFWYRQI